METKKIFCPNCGDSLGTGTTNCPKCQTILCQVSCPDCGVENIAFADGREFSCECGAQIPVASLFGHLPHQKQFCRAIKLLSGFQKFSKQETFSGEIYYEIETNTTSLQIWQVDHFVAQKGLLKNEILLPTQVIKDTGATYYLLTYQKKRGKNIEILKNEPVALAITLFELIEYIHENNYCVPALTPADLDVTPSGKIRLLVGHKLCAHGTPFVGNLNPAFSAPELSHRYIAKKASDIFTAARIWYWIISEGILGQSQPGLDEIPCPRIWCPKMPVGLWGILRACMHSQFEQRPSASNVLLDLKRMPEPVNLILGMHSDVGRKPDHNQEDACGCKGQIAVVSDGVSQSGWGEKASEIVVKTLTKNHQTNRFLPELINKANAAIGQHILENQNASREANQFCDPMSATVVAADFSADFVTIAALGDSSAYLLSASGYLERLTENQNGRWEYIMDGKNFAEASAKEDAMSLARWVGDFELSSCGEIDPNRPKNIATDCQLVHFQWVPGDKLLLCSDGVHDFLSEGEIAAILRHSDDPNVIAQKLVKEAITAQDIQGKGDNVTALVVVAGIKMPIIADFYNDLEKRYPFVFRRL